MMIVMSFEDGTEVWYEAESLNICRDPYGMAAVSHVGIDGAPERPAGDYIEIRGATLARVAGVDLGGASPAGSGQAGTDNGWARP